MRRLAQKQPSFKDSVTAHSSRDFASKIIGAKHGTECEDLCVAQSATPIHEYMRIYEWNAMHFICVIRSHSCISVVFRAAREWQESVPLCDEAGPVRARGACGSKNVGTSNRNDAENASRRKIKVSLVMSIIQGLVGPKGMAKAVLDGQWVNIPTLLYFVTG